MQISASRPVRRMASRVARAYQDQIRRDNESALRQQFAALDHGLVPTPTSIFGGGVPITVTPALPIPSKRFRASLRADSTGMMQ
jgi:hypothetical protein